MDRLRGQAAVVPSWDDLVGIEWHRSLLLAPETQRLIRSFFEAGSDLIDAQVAWDMTDMMFEVFTLLQKFDPALSEEIRERDQERRNKGAGRSRHWSALRTRDIS